jgi:tryptophan synthase alpha chain
LSDHGTAPRWAQLRRAGRTALIPYLTAGYPTPAASLAALRMVAEAGADLIELGVPFSDPVADGPVIQRASEAALRDGMTVGGALELVRQAALDVPVVLFGYLNPLLAYGVPRFLDDATAAGVAGVLLTDLPAGEDPELERLVGASGLDLIPLVALTTTEERARRVLRRATGFVYVVARLGVTGSITTLSTALDAAVRRFRRATELPLAIGFGIASGPQAAAAAALGDGIVVGSALVERLGQGLEPARDLMLELRAALDARPAGAQGAA